MTVDLDAGGYSITGLGAVTLTGLTGATAATREAGATTGGPPTTGTFAVGDKITDQLGYQWICTSAGSPGAWTRGPNLSAALRASIGLTAGRGVLCENLNPAAVSNNIPYASQQVSYMGGLGILNGDTITGVTLSISQAAAGTNPTGAYVGIYTAAGTRLAVSSNLAADAGFTAVGYARFPFSSAYVSTADQAVYAAFLINGAWGTTQAKFYGFGGGSNWTFKAQPSSQSLFAIQSTQATLPSSMGALGDPGSGGLPWVGLY